MELFPMCARSCAVSVPLLDHVGKLLSLGRDKCDCALTLQTKPLQSLLAHALRNLSNFWLTFYGLNMFGISVETQWRA